MAEATKAPVQSREYKRKLALQIIVGLAAAFGLEVDPEDIGAALGGIELGYLIVRKFFRRTEA